MSGGINISAEDQSEIDKILDRGEESSTYASEEINGYDDGYSINIIFNSFIKDQIENLFSPSNINNKKQDFVGMLIKRVDNITISLSSDEEEVNKIKNAEREVYLKIIMSLEEKFDFDFSEISLMNMENLQTSDLQFYAHCIYRFLVIDINDKISDFFANFIFNNKKQISQAFKPLMKDKKILGMSSLRAFIKEPADMIVLYYLEEIILDIIDSSIKFDDFIYNIEMEEESETSNSIMKEIIDGDNHILTTRILEHIKKDRNIDYYLSKIKMQLIPLLPKKQDF